MGRYVILVQWANGAVERYPLPETIPLHIGHGEPGQPVPVFAPKSGEYVGALIVHGTERPYWVIVEQRSCEHRKFMFECHLCQARARRPKNRTRECERRRRQRAEAARVRARHSWDNWTPADVAVETASWERKGHVQSRETADADQDAPR